MNQRQALAKASQYVSVWGHARGYTLSEPYPGNPDSSVRYERGYSTFSAAQKAAKRARVCLAIHMMYEGQLNYDPLLSNAVRIYTEWLSEPDYLVDQWTSRESLSRAVRWIKEYCK